MNRTMHAQHSLDAQPAPDAAAPVMSLRGIEKWFGGLCALQGIDLEIPRNEVMALVGDNGAGKSTLVKVISGAEKADRGTIHIDGRPVRLHSPRDAQELGIATLHQHLGLIDCFGVTENVFLGREIHGRWLGLFPYMRHREMRRQTKALLDRLEIPLLSLDQTVSTMSGGQRQAVAISRLLLDEVSLVIMDEPMAALGVDEGRKVLNLISRLASRGISILIISHNLEHVMGVSDRISVLKNGRLVGTVRTAETTRDEVTSMIIYGKLDA